MANTIDWSTLALGALIGVGCQAQLKSASKIAASTVASLAEVAASTAASLAKETESSEEAAAKQWTHKIDQQIAGNGKKGN